MAAQNLIDVEMPDGTVIEGVPEGTSKLELILKLNRFNQKEQAGPVQREIDKGVFRPGFAEAFLGALGGPGSPEALEPPSRGDVIKQAVLGPGLSAGLAFLQNLQRRRGEALRETGEAIQNVREGGSAEENFKKANLGILQAALAGIPVVGEAANVTGEQAATGNRAGAAGTGLGTLFAVGVGARAGGARGPELPKAMRLVRPAEQFREVMLASKTKPVVVTSRLSAALERYEELRVAGNGSKLAVNRLIQRLTNPRRGPLTYKEARDHYSPISRISADEGKQMSKAMKQQVGEIREALNETIQSTATSAGKGAVYREAMTGFAREAQLKAVARQIYRKGLLGAGGLYLLKKLNLL